MKPVKIASLALMGMLAWGNSSWVLGKGGPEFMTLNVSLTVQQQALYATNQNGDGKTLIWTIDKSKLNNDALLAYMADMFNTNWPEGARLMYWAYDEAVVVTDATGTNILFNCTAGVNNANRRAYVEIDWYNQSGPYKGKAVEGESSSQDFTGYWQGTIAIYYVNYDDDMVYCDLSGDGLNVEKYSSEMTDSSYTTAVKESLTPFALGSVNDEPAFMNGKVTAKGKATYTKLPK
jgi:hypothetical protein